MKKEKKNMIKVNCKNMCMTVNGKGLCIDGDPPFDVQMALFIRAGFANQQNRFMIITTKNPNSLKFILNCYHLDWREIELIYLEGDV